MAKIKIIAHGANTLAKIEKAFAAGANLVEVDVSKQVFTSRFVAQHQGVLGKFGIGENLEEILAKIPAEKIIFDIKHPQFTPSFAEQFDKLLKKYNFTKASLSSDNFQVLEKLSNLANYKIYFLVENEDNVEKLLTLKNRWKNKNFGVSISTKFINRIDLGKIHQNGLEIFVGPINDYEILKQVLNLEIDGIITDNLKQKWF